MTSDKSKCKSELIEELQALRKRVDAHDITELVLSKKKIQEQSEFLETVIESLQHPFLVIDAEDYTIKMSNSAAIHQKSTNQTTCYALSHGRDKPCDDSDEPCPLLITKRTGQPAVVEHIHLDQDGKPIYVDVHSFPIFDHQGNVTKVIEYSLDISERKETEKNLNRSFQLQTVLYQISDASRSANNLNDLYRTIYNYLGTIIDTSNFYIALYDRKTNLISFPFFIDEVDTYPEPGPPGKGITEYILRTGEALFLTKDDIYKLAAAGEIDLMGTPSELWLGAPLIANDAIVGVIAIQSYNDSHLYTDKDLDILNYVSEQVAIAIEHKQSITDLEVEKTYLDELFRHSPEAVALVDNNSIILDINPEFTSLFGYAKEEVIGKHIDELLTDKEQLKNAEKLTNEVRTGRRVFVEANRRKKDGEIVPVSILGSPIHYKGGVLAIYAIYRDITDRKEAEAELKRSEIKYRGLSEVLAEANIIKELLLDVITHDLKNPIGVINGMTDLMQQEDPDNEMLDIVKDSCDNLIQVMDNAMVLAQMATGDEIEKQRLNVAGMLQSIAREFKSQLVHYGMTLEINVPDTLLIQANTIMGEVFKNYISNATKYAKDGKKIIIDTEESDESLTINVKDFGTTIPEEHRQKVFERTYQIDINMKGRGLGLSIVKKIAEAHQAEVGVKPNEPTGNIFYIRFPKSAF
ncbi:MAG: PAS domain S-box protein [Candidatus Marinimicrobia bacterium]|nr:PAS domain S-box protein [Candidatus Neomarinimicrobiota bacterium]